ncbi:hypothetical protein EDD21DRAFT_113131 [Dissophora ornata]|nr:hypothetical protein EDD21DRAFT_113131 [Dissophora ornata]
MATPRPWSTILSLTIFQIIIAILLALNLQKSRRRSRNTVFSSDCSCQLTSSFAIQSADSIFLFLLLSSTTSKRCGRFVRTLPLLLFANITCILIL